MQICAGVSKLCSGTPAQVENVSLKLNFFQSEGFITPIQEHDNKTERNGDTRAVIQIHIWYIVTVTSYRLYTILLHDQTNTVHSQVEHLAAIETVIFLRS